MTRAEKISYIKSLLWDYDISAEEAYEVLMGNLASAGHYNAQSLFQKLIESYRWFTVLKLLDPERIYELLNISDLEGLRNKKLAGHYRFIRDELQRELQVTR